MMGYFKKPEITAASYTPDGVFKTGDMGERDEAGRLRITGRVKEQFKTSKGKYVAPVPIENQLGAHPKIEAVCVCGANHPATYALVVLSPDASAAAAKDAATRSAIDAALATLMDQVNANIDPHEHLAFAVVVEDPWTIENGLLTPTMKIRRSVIEGRYAPHADAWFASGRRVIWER